MWIQWKGVASLIWPVDILVSAQKWVKFKLIGSHVTHTHQFGCDEKCQVLGGASPFSIPGS